MPRNAAGNYTLPLPPVVPGTSIVASFENSTDSDIAAELTNSLDRNGRGGMLAPFKIADGTVSAPGIAFTQDPDNGFYRIGADNWAAAVGGAKVLEFGVNAITVPSTVGLNAGNLSLIGSTGGIAGAVSGGPTGSARLVVASATAGDAAFLLLYRLNTWAGFFGVDTDNHLKYGGGNVGAVAYKILHEGNSFALGVGGMATTQIVTTNDITVTRGTVAGAVFFGNNAGSRYLIYGGNAYLFAGAPVIVEGRLAAGSTDAPLSPFSVRVFTDTDVVLHPHGANSDGCISALTANRSAWKTLTIGGGASSVVPGTDNGTTFGFLSPYRWSAIYAVNGAIQTSDARQKKNIAPSTLGLDFIEDLNPVSYQWIVEKNVVTRVPDGEEVIPEHYDVDNNLIPASTRTLYRDQITPLPGTRTHYGLVAQDVKNAVVASGASFGGLYEGADGVDELGLAYSEFIAPLVKAVQELSAKVRALEGVKP